MPTAKPRLQVALERPHYELLLRLAKLQGRSASAVLAELFGTVYPVMERLAVVLQAAKRAQESAQEGLLQSTEQAERDLRPFLAQAIGQLELLKDDFTAAAGPASDDRAAIAGPAPDPRLVTRGSACRTPGGKQAPKIPHRRPAVRTKAMKRKAKRA